jgi:predicted DsbA family dithiol-disulfide isomerase
MIDGLAILRSEVDAGLGEGLLPLQTELYGRWRTALDEYVDAILLSKEAARQGLRVEELVRREVTERVEPVTEREALAVIEGTPQVYQWLSKAAALLTASDDLRRRRLARRRSVFMAELRSLYQYEVSAMPPRLRSTISGGQTLGRENAIVSIVEFSDFQCSYCAAVSAVLDEVVRNYPDQVRIVFKHFPLPGHPQSTKAAEAALCAGEQNRFWEMQRLLFVEQSSLSSEAFAEVAARGGLDVAEFEVCYESRRHTRDWQADKSEGAALGVSSTPTLFINGRMIAGARTYEVLRQIVDEEIRFSRHGSPADR